MSRISRVVLPAKMRLCFMGLLSFSAVLGGFPGLDWEAQAQVVLSAGVNETYDDNIFLENGDGTPPPIVVDSQLTNPNATIIPPDQADGKKNSDFLTNLNFGASGAPSLVRGLQSTLAANVGGIFFADNSDYDRLTLNTDLELRSQKELLPDPFYVNLSSQIRSQANDSTVAQGTATRMTQVHYASLDAGVRGIDVTRDTKWGLGYRLGYTDFLGDFRFSDSADSNLGPYENRLQNQGSDYFSNGVSTSFDHTFSKQLTGSLGAALNDISFVNVDSSNSVNQSSSQLDRDEFVPSAKLRYQATKALSFDGSAGYNFTRYKDDPAPTTVFVVDQNGNQTPVVRSNSRDQDSFLFSAGSGYNLDAGTNFYLGVNQSTTPDLNGNRLITRAVTLNGTKTLTDRLRGNVSARYLQFNAGQSLTNSNDRYEFTLGLNYSVTTSVAINTGWTYANQQAANDNLSQRVLLSAEDYAVNRFFVGLSAGFLGIPN